MNPASQFAALLVASLFFTTGARAAGLTIDIGLAADTDPLVKTAAEELSGQLVKLFDAKVRVHQGTDIPGDAQHVVLLGTAMSKLARVGVGLPAEPLGESFSLKSIELNEKPALAVAGTSPRAVVWAAYELGWRLGIRYFHFGDIYPTEPGSFPTTKFSVVVTLAEPRPGGAYLRRDWRPTFDSPTDYSAWSVSELRDQLRFYTKLRRYELHEPTFAWQEGLPISVAGDTIGRAAFRGKKQFDNLDLAGVPLDKRADAFRERIWTPLRSHAEQLGWTVRPSRPKVLPPPSILPLNELSDIVSSRYEVDPAAKLDAIYGDIFTRICGEEVHSRVQMAFELVDSIEKRLDEVNDRTFAVPRRTDLLLQHYDSDEPPPTWWSDVRKNYLDAMNEMYRANTRAREGGRAFTLYYARRFEFGFEYMNAVESVHKAGIAKRKGDKDAQIEELEKAIDSVTNCCNAMAAVARTPSDRGVIAVMNEYGYRPLLKLLEEAETE